MTQNTDQLQLRQQLALYVDNFIILSDNPTYLEMIAEFPDLELARQAAVAASDNFWHQFRTKMLSLKEQ